jgi:hypothetical protein
VEKIKKYKTAELINFLYKEEDLQLENEDLEIIRKQRINGRAFLETSKKDFLKYGLLGSPAKNLASFTKEYKKRKSRPFSSYCSLKEVLAKYKIVSDGTSAIPLFSIQTYEIQDDNLPFKYCVDDILYRMMNYVVKKKFTISCTQGFFI